jgi:hypothetical protein
MSQSRAKTPPAATVQLPQRTPVAPKSSATIPYNSSNYKREHHKRRLESEMKGRFVGPMPPSLFLEKFLPVTDLESRPTMNGESFHDVAEIGSEAPMYGPLVCVFCSLFCGSGNNITFFTDRGT